MGKASLDFDRNAKMCPGFHIIQSSLQQKFEDTDKQTFFKLLLSVDKTELITQT